jgi:hypothetical protein
VSYVHPEGWELGMVQTHQGALHTRPLTVIFEGYLAAGTYTFHFGVDENADGIPDLTWIDSVEVRVR